MSAIIEMVCCCVAPMALKAPKKIAVVAAFPVMLATAPAIIGARRSRSEFAT